MVIHSSLANARVLALALLLGMSSASQAQSTEADNDTKDGESWSADLKAPLAAGDDVGGSWNWMLAYGRMTDASLTRVFRFDYGWDEARLVSGDVGYTLMEDNPLVRLLDPVLSTVEVAMNVTYQDDPAGSIFVFSPYMMARWSKFPWSDTLRTTFGLGGGLSWATDIPSIEIEPDEPNGDYSKLLFYIAIEATVTLPKYKNWQLVYRLHHRSGIFGTFQADNSGNTAVQLGLRHYF